MTSTDIIVPALPLMVSELKTNISTIELVISAYMLGFSISMLTTGTLSDIYGRRVVLIYTMLIYILACLLIAFCHNILVLVILRFFQGLGGGSGTVVGRLIIKDYFPQNKQINMMSTLSTGMALAPAVAPQIGALCSKYLNWQSCFFITFMLGCFILWILIFKFKETNLNLSVINPIKQLPKSFILAFNSKEFIGFTLLIGFAWCAYFNFIGSSSFLFQNVYLFSANQYALVIGVVTIGYLLGTSFTRVLNSRHYTIKSTIKIGVASCCGGGIFFLIAYLQSYISLLIAAMFIIRFGIGLIMPSSQVGAMQFHPTNTGWYMGCLFFVEFILGGGTLYLAGFLELIKIGLGMTVSILSSITVLLFGFYLVRNINHERSSA
jgi:DHA1 family bicyclomycin/chloramphenicol resistance-like MFS transporter